MNKGNLFIVSGPSGSGKGTILGEIFRIFVDENLYFSVSATTRAPREGEIDGIHYHFVTRERFTELLNNNGLVEYNILSTGDMYGTPKAPLEEAMHSGRSCILEIDPNGMRQVIGVYPDAVKIFIAPPSEEILEKRIRGRGTETEANIVKRLNTAKKELRAVGEYDYVIVNDKLEDAVNDTEAVFRLYLNK